MFSGITIRHQQRIQVDFNLLKVFNLLQIDNFKSSILTTYYILIYYNIFQVDRGASAKWHLAQAQVCDDMDYTSDMAEDKNGGCVSHGVKKNIQNIKHQKNQWECFNVVEFYLK